MQPRNVKQNPLMGSTKLHSYYLAIGAAGVAVLAFGTHVVARVSHRVEKHYMDKLRRPKFR